MYSAFGVEHGEISKGLPSALRGADRFASGPNNYANTRIAANVLGRQSGKSAKKAGGYLKAKPSMNGQLQRGNSRKFLP